MSTERVNNALSDEIVRAAYRAVDERVRYAEPVYHDGTEMVLVPRGIFDRLETAITLHSDVIGRPRARRVKP